MKKMPQIELTANIGRINTMSGLYLRQIGKFLEKLYVEKNK